jgi:hypothetical protein
MEAPLELRVDASYRDLANWTHPDDQFNKFFRFSDGRGIANAQGFRPKSLRGGSTAITDCGFCVLVTTLREPEWPDALDPDSGLFVYYGDNRQPGRAVADTPIGGNLLLEQVFDRLHSGERQSICPFLCFQKYTGAGGVYMRFLGLAVPGAHGVSGRDDLVAVWRRKGDKRFQNYKAIFTVLTDEAVPHAWLEQIVSGPGGIPRLPPAVPSRHGSAPASTTPWSPSAGSHREPRSTNNPGYRTSARCYAGSPP